MEAEKILDPQLNLGHLTARRLTQGWSLSRVCWPVIALVASLLVVAFDVPASASGAHSPDGALGKPGLQFWGYRTDITLDGTDFRGTDGPEYSSAQGRILLPVSEKVSFFGEYRAENRLNILHQARLGVRLRIFQPSGLLKSAENINPDGPLGYPYFSISAGVRLYESETDARFGVVAFKVAYPWTHNVTIGAGAELNTDTSQTIVDQFFGSLSLYTARFLPDEPYANPDGPVGYLSFRISGGGSGDGVFGQLDVLFPLNDQMTIGGFVRGERVAFPYERNATLGARFQLYPGVTR